MAVRLEFEASELDKRNWVVDFGGLKSLKGWFENTFDHKTLVAKDDPFFATFQELHEAGIIDMVEVEHTGCEKFAELIFECTEIWLKDNGYHPRVTLVSAEVKEHGANSAIFNRRASHTWYCGCGHTNGVNLAVCAACGRTPNGEHP